MLSMVKSVETFEDIDKDIFSDIITCNKHMLEEVFPLVKIYSRTTAPVLITGETGTGKDMLASKIHEMSDRKLKPFVTVNLASISSSLFESELFGHKKGSFTDAREDRIGHFETANGGTIFLDEIGELSKDLQGKLLRVIQYGEICRVGDSIPTKLNVRIILATNINLKEQIKSNIFREDLYYRISKQHIELPPLRKRGHDIVLLTEKFLQAANNEYNKACTIAPNAFNLLLSYNFPGNVRELENIIFSLVARAKNDEIKTFFPQKSLDVSMFTFIQEESNVKKCEELGDIDLTEKTAADNHVIKVWKYFNCKTEIASERLGMNVRTLQRRLKQIKDSGNPNFYKATNELYRG